MLKSYTVDFTAVKCYNNIYEYCNFMVMEAYMYQFKYKYMPDFLILVIDIFFKYHFDMFEIQIIL